MRYSRLTLAPCLLVFALSACALDLDGDQADQPLIEDAELADDESVVRSPIKEFETDGCSASPDGTVEEPNRWLHCCIEHDQAYFMGGTRERKEAADSLFFICMARECGQNIATLYLAAVTAFGGPAFPTSYRWGYGWPPGRGYKALTENEREQLAELIDDARALVEAEKQRDE